MSIMGVGGACICLEEDWAAGGSAIPGSPPAELEEPNGCGCWTGGGANMASELELANALRSDEELPNVSLEAGAALELANGAAELDEDATGPCCVGGSTVGRLEELDDAMGEKEELDDASCLARDELEEPIGCVIIGAAEELDEPMRDADELEEPIGCVTIRAAEELDDPIRAAELLDEPNCVSYTLYNELLL